MPRSALVEALLDSLTPLVGKVEARELMGTVGLYLQGTLFAVVSDGKLFYRTDRLNRRDYDTALDEDEDRAFCPSSGMPDDLAYRQLPRHALDHPELLRDYTLKAWEAGKRAGKAARR